MNYAKFNEIYDFYKKHYKQIEKKELYKWEAVVNFKKYWDIDVPTADFAAMLKASLNKTNNLMSSGNYYPRRMIYWVADKDPEAVRALFKNLYDLSIDIKERIVSFREGINQIIEVYQKGNNLKGYQDDRAIMVYLNMRYPDRYYLYKYTMFKDFAELIDYSELPKAGNIDLVFMFESLCDMIRNKVVQDNELLAIYEDRYSKYYDPEYHLLVQDIVYSVVYFKDSGILVPNEEVAVKKFNLQAKAHETKLIGVHKDYVHEAKKNKEIGDAGEEFVCQYERETIKKYKACNNKTVRLVAKLDGDGCGYDVLSYDEHGNEKYIEVKTTKGKENESIYITANELKKSEEAPDRYYLYRVFDFDPSNMTGKISVRKGSLHDLCISAQTYKVDFK